jgi:hypothetical protein
MIRPLSSLPPHPNLDGAFSSYETLPDLPYRAHALQLLRRCAYIVRPIMQRHGWAVPLLSELPSSSSCHGISYFKTTYTRNRFGCKTSKVVVPVCISLRLRDRHDPTAFVRTYDLVRTLLHELAHYRFSNHFVSFYTFNKVLLRELVSDVHRNEERRDVGFREVPGNIASVREMLWTMKEDLKDVVLEACGVERRGIKSRL